MSKKQRRSKKGIALIVVLMALLVLGTLAGGLVVVTSGHLMHAYSGNESQEALYAARAGAWMKLAQYRSDKNEDPIKDTKLPGSGALYSATIYVGDPVSYSAKSGSGTASDIISGVIGNVGGSKTSKAAKFPPPGTVYVEGVGKSPGGMVRKVGILAQMSQSRWNHAAFGNTQVEMKSGSYTDSFNSMGGEIDHSKASIATNNPKDGIKISDHQSVAVGWAQGKDSTGKSKKKKGKQSNKVTNLNAMAAVEGPPGSLESTVVTGDKNARFSYKSFKTSLSSNQDPVVLPSILPSTLTTADLAGGGTITPDKTSPNPDLDVTGEVSITPDQAFNYVNVQPNGKIVLDVSAQTPGTKVQYLFTGINLQDKSALEVKQPATGGDVTVQVYINTGDGKDPAAGVLMEGSSVVNPSQNPINLQLLIAGKGKNTLEGHDDNKDGAVPKAYFVAYGPEAEIEVFGGQIFGAVVGDKVTMDGDTDKSGNLDPNKAPAVIHYDVSLLEDDQNSPSFAILSERHY